MSDAKPAPLTERPAWAKLREHHLEMERTHLRDLFAQEDRKSVV